MKHAEYPLQIESNSQRGTERDPTIFCTLGRPLPDVAMTALTGNVRPYDSAVNILLLHRLDALPFDPGTNVRSGIGRLKK